MGSYAQALAKLQQNTVNNIQAQEINMENTSQFNSNTTYLTLYFNMSSKVREKAQFLTGSNIFVKANYNEAGKSNSGINWDRNAWAEFWFAGEKDGLPIYTRTEIHTGDLAGATQLSPEGVHAALSARGFDGELVRTHWKFNFPFASEIMKDAVENGTLKTLRVSIPLDNFLQVHTQAELKHQDGTVTKYAVANVLSNGCVIDFLDERYTAPNFGTAHLLNAFSQCVATEDFNATRTAAILEAVSTHNAKRSKKKAAKKAEKATTAAPVVTAPAPNTAQQAATAGAPDAEKDALRKENAELKAQVKDLNAKLDRLTNMMEQFMASQAPAAVVAVVEPTADDEQAPAEIANQDAKEEPRASTSEEVQEEKEEYDFMQLCDDDEDEDEEFVDASAGQEALNALFANGLVKDQSKLLAGFGEQEGGLG